MAGSPDSGGIVGGHVHKGAGVMVGKLHALDVDGKSLRLGADLLGRGTDAAGQQLAKTLATGDGVDGGDHGPGVAPDQVDAARVLLGEEPLFVGLHGKGDDRRGGDGVHAVAVAQVIHPGDGVQVIALAVSAESGKGLVFGAVPLDAGIGALLDLDRFAAADGAGKTVGVALKDGLGDALARDAGCLVLPVPQGPVLEGQVAGKLGGRDTAGGAQL